eukprot:gene3961-4687_t
MRTPHRSVPPLEHHADFARFTVDTVLKRDVFSTVERGTWVDLTGQSHPAVRRRWNEVSPWFALLAARLAQFEINALEQVTATGVTTPLLAALGTPPDVLAEATRYARIMLIAMPGVFVFLISTAMLRGVGDTVTPLLTLLISTTIGMLVTPALIRGWGGLPQLGVTSGAWGSVLSFLVATLWLGWRLRRRNSPLAPD